MFGCEHFHSYLYGRSFELETDHRPLEHIYKAKVQSKPTTARLERWRLRLQEYDFHVVYRPGPFNLADPLSRLSKDGRKGTDRSNMEACVDRYVHYMTQAQTPKAMKLEEIQRETLTDPELQQIKEHLQRINCTSYRKRISISHMSSVSRIKIYYFEVIASFFRRSLDSKQLALHTRIMRVWSDANNACAPSSGGQRWINRLKNGCRYESTSRANQTHSAP